MNRLIIFAVALSFVLTIAIAQNEIDSSESNDENQNVIDDVVNTAEEVYSTTDEITKEQEEDLTNAIGDMVTYFTKSIIEMSNILEDIKTISENNTDSVRNNLVDNLMNYVEVTEIMKQQISHVMALRSQFQESILKQLYSMPISKEDASKLESDLREQIKLRADQIPNIQNLLTLPQIPPQVSKFIPNF